MVFGIQYCLYSSNYNGMDYNLDNLYFINPKNIFFLKIDQIWYFIDN